MYTQGLDSLGADCLHTTAADARGAGAALPGEGRCRRAHRAEGLDARRLSPDAHPADFAARALGDRRHAAGGQLDHARADAASQGRADREGAGRRRPRHVSVQRRRNARHVARRAAGAVAHRRREVFEHLQLSDADLGRRRCDRLAGRRRGDHESDSDLPLLVRSVRARDGAHLQGRELPSAPGLRNHDDAGARHAGAATHGAGRARSLVVAVADDVRPERRGVEAHGAVDALEDQALHATTSCGRSSSTSPCRRRSSSGCSVPDPGAALGRGDASTTASGRSTGPSSSRCCKGNGPCNRERLEARRRAHEGGRWVREAALAHAEKQRRQRETQAA